ncbi:MULTISPECIES: GNAT family N-acetyltransferase [unclassified Streptomyces]|uniref:GNAT family N-acetyltransferase n=1 Tax=unclassified Streptomyces TaxID=2593676 RepID=UPI0006F75AC1|nr:MULTISPECIES: GNAT family N-acetyltransferase [unclassified Streptomyces]KQX53188.1 acetyltransferase [Streptomyces sp. Root1304]KRA90109.1 acetyltransferase [Streptomyces sp. Root66D1]
MTWHFTEDPAVFRASAAALLAADPTRNTGVLTLMDAADRLGWWTEPGDGRVTGVLAVTASRVVVLGTVTTEAARALTAGASGQDRPAAHPRLFPQGETPTAVRGEAGPAEACAAAFAEAHEGGWHPAVRLRLFRLGTLTPPDPAPAGRARVAGPDDIPLATAWAREFARDVGEDTDARDFTVPVTDRISEGRLLLWETPGGRPVSMASTSRTIEGQARIHLVYTPSTARGRGYAAGVTTAVSRLAQESGAAHVLLFTDIANPTSNALYRRLGYHPVTDHLDARLRFTDLTR